MGFDQLPEFPQGGIARSDSGNQGIPPETFQQALLDTGVRLIADSKRPEDSPAVQAALGVEVDALLAQKGLAPQSVPQAPVQPATPPFYQAPATPYQQADTAAQSPEPSGPITPDRIQRIMEKYSSPEELAKAYLHTDAARTRVSQERAIEMAALRSTVDNLQQEISALRNVAQQYVPPRPGNGAPEVPAVEDPEAFFKNPTQTLAPVIEKIVDNVVKTHLTAYTDAQARYMQEMNFEEYRASKAPEIQALRPFMDQIYAEDQPIFESLQPKAALDLLLKRSRERQEAFRGRAFYDEMRGFFPQAGQPGQPGIPAQAAPGQTGSLPGMGAGTSRPFQGQQAQPSDWSRTKGMDQLWKSRSDSVEEMGALTRVLKERGFGEDIPIY